MTTTSEHTGTERYLAPELVISEENVKPTMASDVYALGCLGLEVCGILFTSFLLGSISCVLNISSSLSMTRSLTHIE